MEDEALEVPGEALATLAILIGVFEDRLVAAYLHGSAVSGGLQPQSDVDVLAVIDEPICDGKRDRLLASLLEVSGRHPRQPGGTRCIELMVFLKSELAAPSFPARSEFIYGEWLRAGFEAGDIPVPVAAVENTLALAQARQEALPITGPALAILLADIPQDQVRRAMREGLPALMEGLRGDERNVLLTLARMWHTAATGEFVPKDLAADWAIGRLPGPADGLLALARDGYLGKAKDDWTDREPETRAAAEVLRAEVLVLLQ